MGIKTYQEKNTKPMKKELAQSDIPVMRKIPKTTRKYSFSEKSHFGWFLGFFSKLVSPIELQFFSLAQCPSRTSFDRSHHRSATIFNFDPIMGIFKISDPRWRVKEVEFSKNLFTSMILIYSDSDFHLQYFANSKKVLYDPPLLELTSNVYFPLSPPFQNGLSS